MALISTPTAYGCHQQDTVKDTHSAEDHRRPITALMKFSNETSSFAAHRLANQIMSLLSCCDLAQASTPAATTSSIPTLRLEWRSGRASPLITVTGRQSLLQEI